MSETQTNGAQPSISIQDLQNLLVVVDLATSRGAFRGTELSQVGQLFDKLNTFLQSVAPQQQAPQPVEQTEQPQSVMSMTPPQQMQTPQPVMPMTPPFSPKVGV
jgi:hypothetical protein